MGRETATPGPDARVMKLKEKLGVSLEIAEALANDLLFDGEWRCGDCERVWPSSVKICPCWIPTPEEVAEVDREWRVRNGPSFRPGGNGETCFPPQDAVVISAEGGTTL